MLWSLSRSGCRKTPSGTPACKPSCNRGHGMNMKHYALKPNLLWHHQSTCKSSASKSRIGYAVSRESATRGKRLNEQTIAKDDLEAWRQALAGWTARALAIRRDFHFPSFLSPCQSSSRSITGALTDNSTTATAAAATKTEMNINAELSYLISTSRSPPP